MSRHLVLAGCLAGTLLTAGLAAAASGLVPLPGKDDGDRPPCASLPARPEVERALAGHRAFADQLETAGRDVRVEVATPCRGDRVAALVRVSVGSSASRDRVHRLLTTGDGFGVPVELVER